MTKAELVAKIAEGAGLTKTQAEKMVEVFVAETTSALKTGDKVTLVGFGTFSAVERAARTGRNPQTGAEIKIAAKTNGKFTTGKDLKNLTDEPTKTVEATKPAAKATKSVKTVVKTPTKLPRKKVTNYQE